MPAAGRSSTNPLVSPPPDDSYDSGEYDAGGYGTQTATATPTAATVTTTSRSLGTTTRARASPSTATPTTVSRVLAATATTATPEIVHVSAVLGEAGLARTADGERDLQRDVIGEVDR